MMIKERESGVADGADEKSSDLLAVAVELVQSLISCGLAGPWILSHVIMSLGSVSTNITKTFSTRPQFTQEPTPNISGSSSRTNDLS